MHRAFLRLPTGCHGATMQQKRCLKDVTRCMNTSATPRVAVSDGILNKRQRAWKDKIAKFQVWPQVPSTRSTFPNPVQELRKKQIASLDPTGLRTSMFSRHQPDCLKVGDVLMVTTRTGEPFSGVLIQIRRRGPDTSIQLRTHLMKTPVEMWYKIYSPSIKGIEIVWRRPKRARRARLTYMRKPKHDMGNVDHLVAAWRTERRALRSKSK